MRAIVVVGLALACACAKDGASDESTSVGSEASETGPACGQPSDDAVGPSVAITVVNNTLGVIWLGADSFGGSGFTLQDADGDALAHAEHPCLPSCASVEANPQAVCLECDPEPSPELVRLEVDGRWTGTWIGGAFRQDDVACVDADCGDRLHADACTYVEEVLAGTFSITVQAYAEANGCVNPSCDCSPDADGGCLVAGTPTGPSIQTVAQLDVPTQTTVELVVQ